jgi:hypothetical protein
LERKISFLYSIVAIQLSKKCRNVGFYFVKVFIKPRIKVSLVIAALKATGHHIFRTGYFPAEWSLRLSVRMGVGKALFSFLPDTTVEDVLILVKILLTNASFKN